MTVERNGSTFRYSDEEAYALCVEFIQEDDGTYSAIVLNLPGAGSCGDTEAEARAEVIDAAIATIRSYVENGEEIPWVENFEVPVGLKAIWIDVNA